MKTSSADASGRGTFGPDADVRPAVFDRPLGSTLDGPLWGDPVIERLVAAAIDRGRAQGRAQGFAEGWAQGRQSAAEREVVEVRERAAAEADRRAQDSARLQAVVADLSRAAQALDQALAPVWEELADVITDGALAIARAALGRELASVDEPVVDAVRTAMHALGEPDDIVLRLNPRDLAVLTELCEDPLPPRTRLVPDADVAEGDVLAVTPVQRLHLSMPTAIAAAEEVLRS